MHIPLTEKDRQKTAFRSPSGLVGKIQFVVVPFGLMEKILKEHLGICCEAYIDDVIIYIQTHKYTHKGTPPYREKC